jgi:fumarate reductase subunit C
MPWAWFMRRPGYVRFMFRELTAVPLAIYLGIFIAFLFSVAAGQEAFAGMVNWLKTPVAMALHVLALLAAVYHAVTFFNLLPKGMPVRMGEERVPGALISIGMGYLPWVVVTAFVVWWVIG